MAKQKIKINFLKQISHNKIGLGIILGLLALLVVINVALVTYALQYKDKIYPNSYIGVINFGGKTKSEAEQLLNQKTAQFPGEMTIKVTGHQEEKLSLKNAELQFNLPDTVGDLYAIGRNRSLPQRVKELALSMLRKNEGMARFTLNEQKIEPDLIATTEKIGIKASDAQVVLNDDTSLSISPAKEGLGVTKEMIHENIKVGLAQIHTSIELHPTVITPKVTEQQAEYALNQVRNILDNTPFALKADDVTTEIDAKKAFSWVTYELAAKKNLPSTTPTPSMIESLLRILPVHAEEERILIAKLNSEVIKNNIANLAVSIDNDPINAELRAVDGRITVIKEHTDGQKLKLDEATAQVIGHLSSPVATPNATVNLSIETIAAEVKGDTIQPLGIVELIGRAETNFKGSPTNRIHNISTGATFLNGSLIPKGQEFSTVKLLGKVDGSTGYLPELVIKENRTIPEYGGGLCQVSTTLFRAVLNAGLKVTERQNHSYRVAYYEPPVGLDATIYLPKPDFKFLNDTPGYILVQSKVEGTKIAFELYGTKDGRSTSVTEPVVTDITNPPEPSYTETDTLPKGEVKQIEKAHPGATAVATYTVMRDGKEINKQVFRSKYKPWQARFLVGTRE